MSDEALPRFDRAVKSYYDNAPEETRLSTGTSRLEQARTRELILRHVPAPPAKVLDVGGASGTYAFWLAELGYEVSLVDAVPRLVNVARARNEQAARKLIACIVGDARVLANADASIDVVLLLGPLYHLVERDDRLAALRETARVLRPGGLLLAAAISRWASTLDGLSRELLRDEEFARIMERDLRDGQHRNPTGKLDYFTTAYFHRPDDLRDEVAGSGLDVEALYGIEGPGWMFPDFDPRWNDDARREILLQVARKLESEQNVIGCSAHLLVVGRKGRRS
ncbi:MAG TPA: class I SAM-dependent methyltransferase [Gemmatimonadaceae bacterium]|nr:class I SAM-dependent methyltransferase [Gemmatimonadaceae bacterium]